MFLRLKRVAGNLQLVGGMLDESHGCTPAPSTGTRLPLRGVPSIHTSTQVRFTSLRMDQAGQVHIALVEVSSGSRTWKALVAPPLQGQGERLRVVWQGVTPTNSRPGQTGSYVSTTQDSSSISQVTVGRLSSDIRICGLNRPTVLAPKLLASRDLHLHPALVERLDEQRDFKHLVRLAAQELDNSPSRSLTWTNLLRAVGASSAIGSPSNLTDGDPSTVWAEGGYRDGRWEFVTFRVPSSVPIGSLTLSIRPPQGEFPRATAPKSLWITTEKEAFAVTIPGDAWKTPDTHYGVSFPHPISTSCLSVVLNRGVEHDKGTRVTLAEITAEPAIEIWKTPQEAVSHLDDEGDRGDLAQDLLERGAPTTYEAVAAGYAKLHQRGRRRAMTLLDAADCSVSSWVWAPRLASRWDIERKHAIDRIRRCRRKATSALLSVIDRGPGCEGPWPNEQQCNSSRLAPGQLLTRARLAAVDELSTVAPEKAVPVLVRLLASPKPRVRRKLRMFLARTSKSQAAAEAWKAALTNRTLPRRATLDLLRGVHSNMRAELVDAAKEAFARITGSKLDIDTRYLLCEPAAALARAGDTRAQRFLGKLMSTDPEPMVRARAVQMSAGIDFARTKLTAALADHNVRVRVAAARAVESADPVTTQALVARLRHDDWPMVREASAQALRDVPPSKRVDDALGASLSDPSPKVRLAVLESLGQHRAVQFAEAVRDIADAYHEKVAIRIAAVRTLGQMCDRDAVSLLTIYAKRSANPMTAEAASGLGRAAIIALGRIHPADLRERLTPILQGKRTPEYMKDIAREALSTKRVCSP